MAAETGMDPRKIEGSGKDARVPKGDMMAAIERAAAAPPPVSQPAAAVQVRASSPADDAAREERVKMTRLRQTIARRLKEAQNTAAMLTTFNEVDMSHVMALRSQYKDLFEKKHGGKLGFMGFFVRACLQALREIPAVNADVDADPQRAAARHPRYAQDSGAADGRRRQDRGAADDVSRALLRSPHRRWPRGRHVPGAREGEPGGSGKADPRSVRPSIPGAP